MKYGKFLSAIIKFLIIALVLFFFVQGINRLKEEKKEVPKEPELTLAEKKLLEIRDSLRKQLFQMPSSGNEELRMENECVNVQICEYADELFQNPISVRATAQKESC